MRKIRLGLLTIALSICISGCSKDINYIIDHEPRIKGTVMEIKDGYARIEVSKSEETIAENQEILVSLDAERKDSTTDLQIGDEAAVYYDGNIEESDPARIEKVYAILYIGESRTKLEYGKEGEADDER